MQSNLESGGGLVHSQAVLLALTEPAWRATRRIASCRARAGRAMAARRSATRSRPIREVRASWPPSGWRSVSSWRRHLKSVDAIFARAEEPLA
jgi:hypothetical protein